MHKFFNVKTGEWLPIPGKVYRVNPPTHLIDLVPALREHPLIVHRSLSGTGWTVSHQATSAAIAHGKTREQAMNKASHLLFLAGNDGFLRSLRKAKAQLAAKTAKSAA